MVSNLRKWALVAVTLWTLLMAYLLLSPDTPGGNDMKFFEGQDKVAHFVLFAVWCFLLSFVFSSKSMTTSKSLVVILGASVALALGTELIQHQMPGRSGDWLDGFCDMAGSAFGLLMAHFLKKELIRMGKELDK